MKKSILFVSALALAGTLAAASERGGLVGVAPETEVVVGDHPDTYGTGSLTAYVIPAISFDVGSSASTFQGDGQNRHLTSTGTFFASPMLPNGAQIERIELRACDSDPAVGIILFVQSCPDPNGCDFAGVLNTGALPGCNNFSTTLATPVVVSNANTVIVVQVSMGTTGATTFSAVKLYYRLRISPAPPVATFPTDVPTTHPFFRFIEALAAAGVTGGCGAGSYCPDAAVTRGQMAVFLATSLGLHFPN